MGHGHLTFYFKANQLSPAVKVLIYMVSLAQEATQLGVEMEAIPGRTLHTPSFLTKAQFFMNKGFSICCFCLGLISRTPKWLFLFLTAFLSQILGREFVGLFTPPSPEILP